MSQREAAVLRPPPLPPGRVLVATTDTLMAGVHFPPRTGLQDLAHKALAVNLSDLAAMGAVPLAIQVQVHAPRDAQQWCCELCLALSTRADSLGLGHLVRSVELPAQGLSVLALGAVPAGGALTRHGARPGDEVWVSGVLGDAGAGLELVIGQACHHETAPDQATCQALRARLDRPEPRLDLGQALVGIAHSAIDLSDGLVGDLGHICARSEVAAELLVHRLPLSAALLAWAGEAHARELALCAGDDYELCFTAPAGARAAVTRAAARSRVPVHRVGRILAGRGLRLLDETGQAQPLPAAYQHFKAGDP